MSITVTQNQFHLRTKTSSYVIHIFRDKYPVHLYWGDRLTEDGDLSYILNDMVADRAAGIHNSYDDVKKLFLSDVPMEFSTMAEGLYRTPTYHAKYKDNSTLSDFAYSGYEIIKGKKKLAGLPSVYTESDSEAETLELILVEKRSGVKAILSYTVLEEYDVITRSIRYENTGDETVTLLAAKSASVDFYAPNYELIHMHGDWLREATVEHTKLDHVKVSVESNRGLSSAQQHPFAVLAECGANEEMGKVYGFSLCYSGSFQIEAEPTSTGLVRMNVGISAFDFGWELKVGDSFQTPEVIMVYSGEGLGKMSRTYHKLYRERLCRGKYRDEERPMLINHWDATGTVYTAERLAEIAKAGAETGLELFVMDDGWFGDTPDTIRQLGDWFPDKRKFPNGIKPMVDSITASGMRFGIWFEPEVISVDSHLYKEHPEWVMTAPNYNATPMYGQCILDFANPDVREYIVGAISDILESCDITYLKWDYNRPIIETANQEQKHRAILGLYEVLETLINKFPNVLFEGCSSGGGRFDPGMLYYMPQTWSSDNQRANVRIGIQYGLSLCYPAITMGAHAGQIPLGLEGKNNPMETSAHVAMCGNFGYEMDLAKLSASEMEQVKDQIKLYKSIRKTVQFGDMYRFGDPFTDTRSGVCYKDEDKMVLFTFQIKPQMNGEEWRIKLSCAEDGEKYEYNGKVYSGESLRKLGIRIPLEHYDYQTRCMVFNRIK